LRCAGVLAALGNAWLQFSYSWYEFYSGSAGQVNPVTEAVDNARKQEVSQDNEANSSMFSSPEADALLLAMAT